jgi:hypothetical protein
MKTYQVNKKISQEPKVIGMPLKIAVLFIVPTLIAFFVFYFVGFTLKSSGIFVSIVIVLYVSCSFVSSRTISNLDKVMFSTKIKAITNKSIKPFLVEYNDTKD